MHELEQELDQDEREYLAAFVSLHTPAAAEVQASLAKVHERIAAGDTVAGFEPVPASRAKPWVVIGLATVAVAAAIAMLFRLDLVTLMASESVGTTPGEAAYAGQGEDAGGQAVPREPEPARKRTGGAAAEPEPVAEPSEPEPVEQVESEPEPEPSEPAQRRRRRSTERPSEPEPAADATLHAEIALLRPAQNALRAKDYARALRLLDDHKKSFPRSALAQERSLGRIQALCGLGRKADAQRSIDAFTRKHPGSPLTGRVKSACPADEP